MTKLVLLSREKEKKPANHSAQSRLDGILDNLMDLLSLALAIFALAIPGHLLWNSVAPTYFAWLPSAYHHIPLFDFFSILAVLFIFRDVLFGKISSPSKEKE